MHRRIAAALPTRPDWLAMARQNLARWILLHQQSPGLLRCDLEWLAILDTSTPDQIRALMPATTDGGQRLGQNSPFVGMLSPREVWEIKQRHRDAAA